MSIMFSWLEQKMALCLAEQDSMTFLDSRTFTDPRLKLLLEKYEVEAPSETHQIR